MVEFLKSEEILRNKEMLRTKFLDSLSWAAKSKYVQNYIKKNIGKDQKVLDIGCGGGGILKMLNDEGYRNIWGVDIDNYVKYDGLKNAVKIVDINFEKIPFEDSSLDLITSFQVMEHLENPFHFERECARLLKNGGLFLLSIPSGRSIWSRLSYLKSNNITGYDLINNHISFLTADVFKKIFLKDFISVDEIYDHGFIPHLKKFRLPAHKFFSKRVCYFLRRK